MGHPENIALTARTHVISVRHQLSCQLGEESVVLNLESGLYWGMNPLGARIWELLREECSIADLCERIVGEYDVETEECLGDLLELLREMVDAGLVEVRGGDLSS